MKNVSVNYMDVRIMALYYKWSRMPLLVLLWEPRGGSA